MMPLMIMVTMPLIVVVTVCKGKHGDMIIIAVVTVCKGEHGDMIIVVVTVCKGEQSMITEKIAACTFSQDALPTSIENYDHLITRSPNNDEKF